MHYQSNNSDSTKNAKNAEFIHVYFLGVATVVSGVYVGWNTALQIGFYEFFGAVVFIGSGFSVFVHVFLK